MGLDLHLLPFDSGDCPLAFSHTVLNCIGAGGIYDFLQDEPQMRVPDNFNSFCSRDDKYEDTHYGRTIETPYGEPLMFVELESLLKLKISEIVQDCPQNVAIWAYLAALPPRTKIALYWH